MKKSLMAGVSIGALAAASVGVGAFALTIGTSPAMAGNAYLALGAGFVADTTRSYDREGDPTKFGSGVVEFDAGPLFEAAVGYDLGAVGGSPVGIRAELQATYINLNSDRAKIDPSSTASDAGPPLPRPGNLTHTLLMANLLVDVGTYFGLTPYAGVGIGIALSHIDTGKAPIGPSFIQYEDESDAGFVWQLILGASFPVAPNLDAYGNYRLIGLPDMENLQDRMPDPPGPTEINDDIAHAVSIGVRYNF